ncbi:GH1 family beta-glucosidase [Simiduia sp. 21SJ11W-1]|uniref:GH1 family beta-glucosidase n=1 Tax=Simiduia sp. 21SJ11W-1 TaxID=2909669 RepID=UPI00209E631B|nr:GH1 family beta-glucosidase [Simiduia sp. 21SJ11W-1]UTA47172.1 GH1 family beta-glucosidase [Simiduia sp. 21SJ11W-1]
MKIQLPAHSPLATNTFTYGVATAAFQIEGAADQRLPCIWDTFCAQPGTISDGSNGLIACDHINRWRDDLALIEQLNVDAYRFSVSWPRVMHADGSPNHAGLNFYLALLDALGAKGIKAYVTLYHWDLPQHLEDAGGWQNRETAYKFQAYADLVSRTFGDRVHSYATLNEPFCSAYLGYEVGIHAPGIACQKAGRQAAHHLLLAHGLAMQVLQKNSPNSLNGIVLNMSPGYPKTQSLEDQEAAALAEDFLFHWYAEPLFNCRYPARALAHIPADAHPHIETGDMEIIGQPLDYLGLNYYTRGVYHADPATGFGETIPNGAQVTDMGWEVFPQGLTDLLTGLNARYALPPVYITENGAAMKDQLRQGEVNDQSRLAYFQSHLRAVHNAVAAGVDVQGYFAWSLMDNFEWALGYEKRFGIVHVDYATQKRTIKASGHALAAFFGSRSRD